MPFACSGGLEFWIFYEFVRPLKMMRVEVGRGGGRTKQTGCDVSGMGHGAFFCLSDTSFSHQFWFGHHEPSEHCQSSAPCQTVTDTPGAGGPGHDSPRDTDFCGVFIVLVFLLVISLWHKT